MMLLMIISLLQPHWGFLPTNRLSAKLIFYRLVRSYFLLSFLNANSDSRIVRGTSRSGGQQQRVAIARALITKPAIVLADEPTGHLDSKPSAEVLGLIKRTSAEFRQTVVMITHNNDIARLADRIVRIEDGKIVE